MSGGTGRARSRRGWRWLLAPTMLALAAAAPGAFPAGAPSQQAMTPAPFVAPEPGPSPTPVCPGLQRNRLIVYERGRVTDDDPAPLNIRQGPGTANEIIGRIETGGVFFVLGGPECSERYAWYRVRYGALEGWIAEGTATAYFVEPYLHG